MYRSCIYIFKNSIAPKNVVSTRPTPNFRSVLNGCPQVMCKHTHFSKSLQSSARTKFCCSRLGSLSRHFSQQKVEFPKTNSQPEKSSVHDYGASTHQNSYEKTEEELFDNIDFKAIVGEDDELLKQFKLLMLEVDVLRQDGMKVPKRLTTDNWKELFSLQTRSQRRKLLDFLWTIEMKELGSKKKREQKKLLNEEKRAQMLIEREKNEHINYGFQGVTIFLRVYETTMNLFYNNRLIQAMQFGQNIVVDCGYDKDMTSIENKLCAKQLVYMFAENRNDCEPFNLHFCNINKNSILFEKFHKAIPTIDDPAFPINVSEDNYLNLFPKDKLVYLTPHCRTELKEFSPDDIYIIGALVDKKHSEPLSMAKAKSEGIRMAKFPLDRYLDWNIGTKSLTVNQVLKILLDLRTSGDWNVALKNVPQRKIRRVGEPIRQSRKKFNRGTILQPPPIYNTNRRW